MHIHFRLLFRRASEPSSFDRTAKHQIARRSMMIGGLFLLQFDLDFTFLVFLISHGNPKMITVPRKSKTQTVV